MFLLGALSGVPTGVTVLSGKAYVQDGKGHGKDGKEKGRTRVELRVLRVRYTLRYVLIRT